MSLLILTIGVVAVFSLIRFRRNSIPPKSPAKKPIVKPEKVVPIQESQTEDEHVAAILAGLAHHLGASPEKISVTSIKPL